MTSRLALLFLVLATGPALADQDPLLPAPPPFQPQVDDPMLTPVPSASRQVGTWEEALGLVRERSTDLRIAEANVQRAEGRWRQALATLLPNGRVSAGVATDLLNPGVPVVVDPDRVRGIRKAADDGADSVVLDDGFQHRRAARNLDFVLVSADDWSPSVRLLPAGPYRESPESLRRASAVLITAKAVSPEAVEKVGEWIAHVAPGKPVAVLSLVQYDLVRADLSGETRPVSALAGKRIVAVAALGNPSAFFRQLEAAGATVIPIRFADHHPFTTEDAARAARLSRGADFVVCTLKDAVKLAPLWPATASPLWYVSLSVEVDRGEAALDEMLRRLPGRRG